MDYCRSKYCLKASASAATSEGEDGIARARLREAASASLFEGIL